jgi:hypothetical protein
MMPPSTIAYRPQIKETIMFNLRREFACATKLGKHTILVAVALTTVATAEPAASGELTQRPVQVWLNAPAPSPTRWIALASSTNGRVFQSSIYDGEEAARQAARSECEQTTGRTCNVTISVPSNWDAVVLQCGSRVFMGGSGLGYAFDKAMEKAGDAGYSTWECRQIASY